VSPDDVVLACQRALDRAILRFRRGGHPQAGVRRLLIVQIDGLSRAVLEHALAKGRMPFVKRLLQREEYRLESMSVGIPTSTPAFQMAAMYGVLPDIPGFHYYSRERQGDVHFPRAGHAAWVEAQLAAGRRGLLEGGSAYGCCFTGGAANNFYTFATLTRPSGRGLLSALSPYLVLAWVVAKNLGLTVYELARALPRSIALRGRARPGRRWLWLKIGISIWVRNLFTLAVAHDLYEGTERIYVNYLDYDEAAHASGPRSRRALQTLRGLDRAIEQLWRVMRRVPEHRYDAYILADHGQSPCRPYQEVAKGRRLERWIFDAFLDPAGADVPEARRTSLTGGMHRRAGTPALLQRFMNYLDEDYFRRDDPEAYEQNGARAIAAGPNAFVYALDAPAPLAGAALERRFPGLAEKLSASPGIGFVLARPAGGGAPLCFWRGKRCELTEATPGPFAGRADAALVVAGLAGLMRMPSAGDLVIYGGDAGGTVSFICERGAHAGPSADEMQTFIIGPSRLRLPRGVTHPSQLYDYFMSLRLISAGSTQRATRSPLLTPVRPVTRRAARSEPSI
jgi:hypothetical protein